MITPVAELIAKGAFPSLSPSGVLPAVIDHVMLVVSPVVTMVATVAPALAVSARLTSLSVTVGAVSVIVIVIVSVSAVTPSVA